MEVNCKRLHAPPRQPGRPTDRKGGKRVSGKGLKKRGGGRRKGQGSQEVGPRTGPRGSQAGPTTQQTKFITPLPPPLPICGIFCLRVGGGGPYFFWQLGNLKPCTLNPKRRAVACWVAKENPNLSERTSLKLQPSSLIHLNL